MSSFRPDCVTPVRLLVPLCLAVLAIANLWAYDEFGSFSESLVARSQVGPPPRRRPVQDVSINQQPINRNTTSTKQATIPRFLLGIMSYDKTIEWRRRRAIRQTYLSYFRDFATAASPHLKLHSRRRLICPLSDLLAVVDPSDPLLEECRIVYAFVLGSNPQGPTELLEFNDSFSLLATAPTLSTPPEPNDLVHLNIQENGKFGKSPTWFKYGLWAMETHPLLHFDYIAKMDTDAALYPERFLTMVERHGLQGTQTEKQRDGDLANPRGELVYGGSPFDKKMCGFPQHDHCALLQTPIYMGGAFYFLSTPLAAYITGVDCPRSRLRIPHEDMTTGNYVWSHPNHDQIQLVKEPTGYRDIWRHSVKNPNRLYHFYLQHLQALEQEGIVTREQIQVWNGTVLNSSKK